MASPLESGFFFFLLISDSPFVHWMRFCLYFNIIISSFSSEMQCSVLSIHFLDWSFIDLTFLYKVENLFSFLFLPDWCDFSCFSFYFERWLNQDEHICLPSPDWSSDSSFCSGTLCLQPYDVTAVSSELVTHSSPHYSPQHGPPHNRPTLLLCSSSFSSAHPVYPASLAHSSLKLKIYRKHKL